MSSGPVYYRHLAGIDLYKMGRNLDSSDLTELRGRFDNGLLGKNILWQDFFMRYGTHIHIYLIIVWSIYMG